MHTQLLLQLLANHATPVLALAIMHKTNVCGNTFLSYEQNSKCMLKKWKHR